MKKTNTRDFTTAQWAKFERVVREWTEGRLYSSSGRRVKSRKQAIAIAMSEARARGRH